MQKAAEVDDVEISAHGAVWKNINFHDIEIPVKVEPEFPIHSTLIT